LSAMNEVRFNGANSNGEASTKCVGLTSE
jgi:hypothetical protein